MRKRFNCGIHVILSKLAANFAGLDAELLNRVSALLYVYDIGFTTCNNEHFVSIVSRILFNHLYINQKTQVAAALRYVSVLQPRMRIG